jgi:hypothetical protein
MEWTLLIRVARDVDDFVKIWWGDLYVHVFIRYHHSMITYDGLNHANYLITYETM